MLYLFKGPILLLIILSSINMYITLLILSYYKKKLILLLQNKPFDFINYYNYLHINRFELKITITFSINQ